MSIPAALASLATVIAAALPAATPASAPSDTAALRMVSESATVADGGTFATELHPVSPLPAGAMLSVTVAPRLTTRTGFAAAAAGTPAPGRHLATVAVAAIALPDGNLGVQIPVNPAGSTTGPFPAYYATSGSSVYPVSFQVTVGGSPFGSPLVGFLSYAARDPFLKPLAVALTVPMGAPVAVPSSLGPSGPARLPAPAAAAVDGIATALATAPTVPVTVAATPDTLARLGAGSSDDRAALAALATTMSGPSQLLAEPYVPIDSAALVAGGLQSVVAEEDGEGAGALGTLLHRTPDRATAVVVGPVPAAALQALAAAGATRFVVADGALTPLPAADTRTTYGRPALLTGRDLPAAPVVGIDAPLSAYLAGAADPALAAVDLLAGLAVVQLESPHSSRGVALAPPLGSVTDPAVLRAVLAGLGNDPFVTPVTADGLFAAVPPAPAAPTRAPVDTRPAVPLAGSRALAAAELQVQGLAGILPDEAGRRTTSGLHRDLLLAASSSLDDSARAALVAAVEREVAATEAGVGLPPESSITLTARNGTIPLTVLSHPGVTAHVDLRVTSSKLSFRPFDAGAGPCRIDRSGTEICPLVLTSEATTLRLPVESRTSGVFVVDVALTSPDGKVVLVTRRDTVRSTAFSNIGLVLIGLAALGIAVWWVRDARRGRRARQLVEPRTGEMPVVTIDDPPAPPASWPGSDPDVERFFASPPPEWHPASPSRPLRGPNI